MPGLQLGWGLAACCLVWAMAGTVSAAPCDYSRTDVLPAAPGDVAAHRPFHYPPVTYPYGHKPDSGDGFALAYVVTAEGKVACAGPLHPDAVLTPQRQALIDQVGARPFNRS